MYRKRHGSNYYQQKFEPQNAFSKFVHLRGAQEGEVARRRRLADCPTYAAPAQHRCWFVDNLLRFFFSASCRAFDLPGRGGEGVDETAAQRPGLHPLHPRGPPAAGRSSLPSGFSRGEEVKGKGVKGKRKEEEKEKKGKGVKGQKTRYTIGKGGK